VGTEQAEQAEDAGSEPRAAESGFHARRRIVPVLRQGVREIVLDRPALTIGRSAACEIQLSSALISRRHARLTLTQLGVTVEDLSSRNGVYVNSVRVIGSARLKPGDRLAIGDEVLVFAELSERERGDAATQAAVPAAGAQRDTFADEQLAVATRSADVFQLLASVVDKSLALGRGDEAERVIASHLQSALDDATSGRPLPPDMARTAAGYAVKLAGATGKPRWLDHAVKLYDALDLVLPLALVDEMYVLLRRVRGLDLEVLRTYTEHLRTRSQELAPAERFVLQRLLGLERLASWQTSAGI